LCRYFRNIVGFVKIGSAIWRKVAAFGLSIRSIPTAYAKVCGFFVKVYTLAFDNIYPTQKVKSIIIKANFVILVAATTAMTARTAATAASD
jgi:phage-related minor tail protein